jgi:predicted transcriptional regulator
MPTDSTSHNTEAGTALLVSIRPRFVEQIFAGTKTAELRRVRPRVTAGDLVIVYASGHEKALVGAFQVADVIEATPADIWARSGASTGLKRTEFDAYYSGVSIGYAINISRTWRLSTPVRLETLRRRQGGFHPPQGYRYLDLGEVFSMGGEALLGNTAGSQERGDN